MLRNEIMDNNQIKAQIVKTLTDAIAEIKAEQERNLRALIGHNTVISTSDGLYLRQEGNMFIPTSISSCSRYTPEHAAHLVNTLPQSPDWVPVAVNLHTALARELASMTAVLNVVETNSISPT